jgi:hypothetical protein
LLLLLLLLLLQVIRRVDPPSEGVEFARTQSISIDFSGHDVVAHFGGVEEVSRQLRRSRVLSWHSGHSTACLPAATAPPACLVCACVCVLYLMIMS